MNKIYIFSNGLMTNNAYHGMAISEDGHVVAQCISSSLDWVKSDLGYAEGSDKCHERYLAHFPHGFELEWVDDPNKHKGMLAAQKENHRMAAEAKIEELEMAEKELENGD